MLRAHCILIRLYLAQEFQLLKINFELLFFIEDVVCFELRVFHFDKILKSALRIIQMCHRLGYNYVWHIFFLCGSLGGLIDIYNAG